MKPADLLFQALADPAALVNLDAPAWNQLIRVGRAERLLGSLAARAAQSEHWGSLPAAARNIFSEEMALTEHDHRRAAWEINRAAHALRALDLPVVLLKGSAYLHAGLSAANGRRIGDLDILVPRARLTEVEAALIRHGWEQAKQDAYDDHYYRAWMHELPPMVHGARGGVIDVHHTILPLTARLTPDSGALIESAIRLEGGLSVLGEAEMILHGAAHLAYDGEFDGGARGAWDIHCLLADFTGDDGFWDRLRAAAADHELEGPLARALWLAKRLYNTPVRRDLLKRADLVDRLALRKIRARDDYGMMRAPMTDTLLYMRGHWLRMPPSMLAQHLFRKYRARKAVG